MIAYQPTGNPSPAKKLLHRRQHQLHPKPSTSSWHSVSSSSNRNSRLWMVEEAGYENPQKEMDFPSAKLADKLSRSNLRIDPYAKADLHDRYLSSEEEASPSPDDEHASGKQADSDENDVEGENADDSSQSHKKSRTSSIQTCESDKENAIIDLFAISTPSLAIAVPILAVGRPKLIDVTNLAPMHKRKRSSPSYFSSISSSPNNTNSTSTSKPLYPTHRHSSNSTTHTLARHPTPEHSALDSFPTPTPLRTTAPATPYHHHHHHHSLGGSSSSNSTSLKRHDSVRLHQPDTWLPPSPTSTSSDDYDDAPQDHYFPDLDVRPTPSYHDYDPYSLDPPRLVPTRQEGLVRGGEGGGGWRGVARGLSLGRRVGGVGVGVGGRGW